MISFVFAYPSSTPVEDDSRAKYEARLESYETTHRGGLRRIYPNGNEDYYAPFYTQSTSLCAETAASKMRVELSRQQREEIKAKQKETESFKQRFGGGGGKPKSDDVRPESPQCAKKVSRVKAVKQRPVLTYNSNGHRLKSDDTVSDANT